MRKPQLTRKSGAAYAPGTWCLLSEAGRTLSAAAYATMPFVALEVTFALRSQSRALLSFFTLAFFALLILLLREE